MWSWQLLIACVIPLDYPGCSKRESFYVARPPINLFAKNPTDAEDLRRLRAVLQLKLLTETELMAATTVYCEFSPPCVGPLSQVKSNGGKTCLHSTSPGKPTALNVHSCRHPQLRHSTTFWSGASSLHSGRVSGRLAQSETQTYSQWE